MIALRPGRLALRIGVSLALATAIPWAAAALWIDGPASPVPTDFANSAWSKPAPQAHWRDLPRRKPTALERKDRGFDAPQGGRSDPAAPVAELDAATAQLDALGSDVGILNPGGKAPW